MESGPNVVHGENADAQICGKYVPTNITLPTTKKYKLANRRNWIRIVYHIKENQIGRR